MKKLLIKMPNINKIFTDTQSLFLFEIKKQHITVFIATILWGLAAHGYMYFNKLSWHDDIGYLFDVGATYSSGRWFLGILGECVQMCFGNVSVPWFNGLMSLLFVAVSNVFLVELFHLKRNVSCILLGGMMIVFPSWVSTYAYMFTVSYYAVAVFLAVLGIYLVWEDKTIWRGMIAGAVCICLSLGIYQAYLPLAVTVLLIAFLDYVIVDSECSFWEYLKKGFSGVLTVLLGLILYFVINHIFLSVKQILLTGYQGIDQMGHTDLKTIAQGIISAYKVFILPKQEMEEVNMYRSSVMVVYYVALILTAVFLIWHIVQCWKKNHAGLFFLAAGALCFPVGVNLLYLMGTTWHHGIMLYAKVMVFILPIVLAERIRTDALLMKKYAVRCLSIVLIYVSVFYVYFANVCYLQAEYQQKEVIAWMNTLVTRIQSQKGYRPDLPIAYLNCVGEGHDVPTSTTTLMNMSDICENFPPYGGNFSKWKTGMLYWCGFSHEEIIDTSKIQSMKKVQKMPAYPAAGSVRIIDGVIVVKFSPDALKEK